MQAELEGADGGQTGRVESLGAAENQTAALRRGIAVPGVQQAVAGQRVGGHQDCFGHVLERREEQREERDVTGDAQQKKEAAVGGAAGC